MVSALELCQQIPWTTTRVEQSHGSMAVMHRQHKELGAQQLSLSSFLHSIRVLVAPDPMDVKLARKEERLSSIFGKKPQKAHGYQAFVSDMANEYKRQLPVGTRMTFARSQQVIRDCPWRWRALPDEVRAGYTTYALLCQGQEKRLLLNEAQAVQDDIDLFHQRREMELIGSAARNSRHRFSDADMTEASAIFDRNFAQSRGQLKDRCGALCTSPELPLIQLQKDIVVSVPALPSHSEAGDCLPWAKQFCRFRQDLRSVLLMLENDTENRAFMFVFATQQPLRAYFLMARHFQPNIPLTRDMTPQQLLVDARRRHLFHFELTHGAFCTDRYFLKLPPLPKWAFTNVNFNMAGALVTDREPVLLDHLLSGFSSVVILSHAS